MRQKRSDIMELGGVYVEGLRSRFEAVSNDVGGILNSINPNKQLADARNTQRKADVNTILNAVYQYTLDNKGVLPTGISTTATEMCATGAVSCVGLTDLSVLTAHSRYVVSLPIDPTGAISVGGDGYLINKDADNRVVVTATQAENGAAIVVTR